MCDMACSWAGPMVENLCDKENCMKKQSEIPTEHQEQVAFFQWWAVWSRGLPYLAYAVPNGGARNAVTGAILKREGVMRGIPDIFIDWPRCGYHGLRIELKRRKGGVVSGEQREVIRRMEEVGYKVVVAKGWQEAAQAVESYAGLKA